MRFLLGHLFDAWNNLVFCVEELKRSIQESFEDALDAWGDDE